MIKGIFMKFLKTLVAILIVCVSITATAKEAYTVSQQKGMHLIESKIQIIAHKNNINNLKLKWLPAQNKKIILIVSCGKRTQKVNFTYKELKIINNNNLPKSTIKKINKVFIPCNAAVDTACTSCAELLPPRPPTTY